MNAGALPTNVSQQAVEVGKAPALTVAIDLPEGVTILDGSVSQTISHLDGALGAIDRPFSGPANPRRRATVRWLVRAPAGTDIRLSVAGARAGRDERTVRLVASAGGAC